MPCREAGGFRTRLAARGQTVPITFGRRGYHAVLAPLVVAPSLLAGVERTPFPHGGGPFPPS